GVRWGSACGLRREVQVEETLSAASRRQASRPDGKGLSDQCGAACSTSRPCAPGPKHECRNAEPGRANEREYFPSREEISTLVILVRPMQLNSRVSRPEPKSPWTGADIGWTT